MDKVDLEGYQFFASPSDRALLSEVLDRLAAVEEENRQIKTALEERDDEIAALREEIALERAYDRQRLARLEARPRPSARRPPGTTWTASSRRCAAFPSARPPQKTPPASSESVSHLSIR